MCCIVDADATDFGSDRGSLFYMHTSMHTTGMCSCKKRGYFWACVFHADNVNTQMYSVYSLKGTRVGYCWHFGTKKSVGI